MPPSSALESRGLTANQWKFLDRVEDYVAESAQQGHQRKLVLESTRRQFRTADSILRRLTGNGDEVARPGVLLADDVGLGKTTVAAMVAWVVARAGDGRQVRILAPNDVMVRRWHDELVAHVAPLNACAKHLRVAEKFVKVGTVGNLQRGSIQVAKHSQALGEGKLACDLLIVDEAHRAKGEASAFSLALKKQQKYAKRMLFLTATPFSIQLGELKRMLAHVGASHIAQPLTDFQRVLDILYAAKPTRRVEDVAERLVRRASEAVAAISPYLIRHGIDQLPDEHDAFGLRADWQIDVPAASEAELSLMLRMDRVLRLMQEHGIEYRGQSNDPRFHVGWRHLDSALKVVEDRIASFEEPARSVVHSHVTSMRRLLKRVGVHSKMQAVGDAVASVVNAGEKVVLFCHHHATAQELTLHLAKVMAPDGPVLKSTRQMWSGAWTELLSVFESGYEHETVRDVFVDWLSADSHIRQAERWLPRAPKDSVDLVRMLQSTPARHHKQSTTVAEAAAALFAALLKSKSGLAVLRLGAQNLPAGAKATRVFATCEPDADERNAHLFMRNQQPDTVMAIFNSPFGPDALVVTDRLSEGVDLHRYCRHLVHYELDPSPSRTVQRNGRLRRVQSWAAVIGEPIRYAYPAFRGTRDQRLVEIMKKRLDSFSLLLGGVQGFDLETDTESDEAWREDVIVIAKRGMVDVGRLLCCHE